MRRTMLLTLIVLLLTPSLIAQPKISDEEIIQAFMACPEIIAAQDRLLQGALPGEPIIVLRNMQCGVVGCQYAVLVAQRFERREVNPFVVHILGFVHVGPEGHVTIVEKVELKPEKAMEGTDRTH